MVNLDPYRLALELSPVPMLLASPDGRIQLANRELASMFGYTVEDLLGREVECLLPKELRSSHPELRAAYQKMPVRRQMGQGRDLQGVKATGEPISLELGLHPIAGDGETWTLVSAIDTTFRKRSEALVRATLDASASAMVMVAGNGRIVSVNRAALELFGYEETELVGQEVEVLVPPNLREQHRVYRNNFFQQSAARPMGSDATLYGYTQQGEAFRIEAALTPVEVDEEKLVLATIVDLSERLAAERARAATEAAEAQADRLARLNDELTRFAYSASHDLKGPLATMSGLLQLCIDDLEAGDTAEVQAILPRLRKIASATSGRIEAVLKLARIGHEQAEFESIDLDSLVQQIWEEVALGDPAAPKLQLNIPEDFTFASIEIGLRVILENLLSNSCKYRDEAKEERWTQISAGHELEWIVIRVADNGIGLSEDECQVIFSPFEKLSPKSGDGLGLAIARRQVDHLGGSLRCEGKPGEGVTFTLRLPETPPWQSKPK